MQRLASFAVAAVVTMLLFGAPGQAASSDRETKAAAVELSAQARPGRVRTRPRTQLRVYPRYPRRNFHTFYPLPYDIEYPGPDAVRHCVSRLVQEHRPSGTVIVPRTRCWWMPR